MSDKKEFIISERKTIFSVLTPHDVYAKEHSYIEVTEWSNGEGYDISIDNYSKRNISIGWVEFKLLKKLIKELDK